MNNIKLFLYSKLNPTINLDSFHRMNEKLRDVVYHKPFKVGYIASQGDPNRIYFNKAREFYQRIGINNFLYFDLENEYDPVLEEELFTCDLIHLTSGNTYTYLFNLRKRNLIEKLRNYGLNGGVLVAVSAGCHLMCRDIKACLLGDQNEVGLIDIFSLGLIPFKVIPHFNIKKEKLEDIKTLSKEENLTYYLLEDGQGIVVEDEHINLYGNIIQF